MSTSVVDLAHVRARLRELDRVVVAFSGGADSALLAWLAHDELGPERAEAVTAVSPSLAGFEADDCASLAAEWGLRWRTVATDEMANAAYRSNDGDRCFHCKDALMDALEPLANALDALVSVTAGVPEGHGDEPIALRAQEAASAPQGVQLNCRDTERVIDTFFDGELEGRSMRDAAMHITRCKRCEAELQDREQIHDLFSRASDEDVDGIDLGAGSHACRRNRREAPSRGRDPAREPGDREIHRPEKAGRVARLH